MLNNTAFNDNHIKTNLTLLNVGDVVSQLQAYTPFTHFFSVFYSLKFHIVSKLKICAQCAINNNNCVSETVSGKKNNTKLWKNTSEQKDQTRKLFIQIACTSKIQREKRIKKSKQIVYIWDNGNLFLLFLSCCWFLWILRWWFCIQCRKI